MIRAGIIGFVVALLMWLPPILHLLTGPLGPIVGGFIAGSRIQASLPASIGLGLLMGLFMITPMVAVIVFNSTVSGVLPSGVSDILVYVCMGIVGYTGLMGCVGAFIGGCLSRQQSIRDRDRNSILPSNYT